MNNRLPAGQAMQGSPASIPQLGEMASNQGPRAGGPPRRQMHGPYPPVFPQHMNPYATPYQPPPFNGQFYQQLLPHQYHGNSAASAMPSAAFVPYPAYNSRSIPTMQSYTPMVGVSVPQPYAGRQPQVSPGLSTMYQPPLPPPPSHTPSSTYSAHAPPPTSSNPPQMPVAEPPILAAPSTSHSSGSSTPPHLRKKESTFSPPLPWFSSPDSPWPEAAPKSRRKRRVLSENTEFSHRPEQEAAPAPKDAPADTHDTKSVSLGDTTTSSEVHSSHTPSSEVSSSHTPLDSTVTKQSAEPATVAVLPASPSVPPSSTEETPSPPVAGAEAGGAVAPQPPVKLENGVNHQDVPPAADDSTATETPAAPAKPKLWTGLFGAQPQNATRVGGVDKDTTTATESGPGALAADAAQRKGNSDLLAEAIRSYQVGASQSLSYIEPRGLTNRGNICYMNSVLQVLLFCSPFYDLLDQVSKKAVHSFKSNTPLINAMIMFMKEFNIIATAPSAEQLHEKVKSKDKVYGEPLTPNFLYDEVKKSITLEQGHQQDAEEFLGLLLQALDDECSKVVKTPGPSTATSVNGGTVAARENANGRAAASDDWLEVGRRQRSVITRSVGPNSSSPISKIFGGTLRSELLVPGHKPSITTEPYQPLQLDIGSANIRNITDALRGLASREKINEYLITPEGQPVDATKQVSIDELPPVLILHLKRFQFDAEGGTLKVSKKVGYPLELEIPRDVLSRPKLNRLAAEGSGLPRYKLLAVVYHHGKNASIGHYTVDVRRQDGQQWIRIDDTKISTIRPEDVVSGGAEDGGAKTVRKEQAADGASSNRFGGMDAEDNGDGDGWKQVTSNVAGTKKWSSVVNGTNRPTNNSTKGKQAQDAHDRTVAYILFYQRV